MSNEKNKQELSTEELNKASGGHLQPVEGAIYSVGADPLQPKEGFKQQRGAALKKDSRG